MEPITNETYPQHWNVYEQLHRKINDFIENNPELVKEVLRKNNSEPLPLLPLYFDERNGLGGTDGSYIKLNEQFKKLPLNMFESTLAHEMGHVFFDDPSILSKTPVFDWYHTAKKNECRADHFSIFFSSDQGKGREEKYDGTTYGLMESSGFKDALRSIYKATISVHPSNEKGLDMAHDKNLKSFVPGTISLDENCDYTLPETPNFSKTKNNDGHSK